MQKDKLRIMVLGAHPDDCELTTGGTCVKYRKLGHVVKYVYTTNGNAGHHKLSKEEIAKVRALEVKAACEVAGFEYEIMDNNDGYLEADITNRDKLIRIIRKFQPDIIFAPRLNDYHTDHRRTSILLQDASYLLMVPHVCPDVPPLRYCPVIMYVADDFNKPVPFEPTIVVDIDDVFETKMKILDCHKSQFYEWLPWVDNYENEVPADKSKRLQWLSEKRGAYYSLLADKYRHKLIERYGEEKGSKVKYIEAFEISEYGAQPTREQLSGYFPF
ncbi:MAG TPA: PIG-L family deacetylase [Clostridiaceae bacterium]|nr:PIG-L family deacetylase [Clostridiaceae bacterium]